MGEGRPIPIDFERLTAAMEDQAREFGDYFLDKETGEMVMIPVELEQAVEGEDWGKEKERLPDWERELVPLAESIYLRQEERWARVPEIPSGDIYRQMVKFAATVQDEHLRELLEVALDGKGAFRRFKDVLARYPEERERWFEFEERYLRREAEDWLHSIGVKPREAR
ncbi:MAG: UPF0158 family protein [Candidatus Bipolaricaulia bacterium]